MIMMTEYPALRGLFLVVFCIGIVVGRISEKSKE